MNTQLPSLFKKSCLMIAALTAAFLVAGNSRAADDCEVPPSATISGSQVICAGANATLSVALTGTPNWSFTVSDGTNTTTYSDIASSPATFVVNPTVTTTYTIVSVTDGNLCSAPGTGSATVSIGPTAYIKNTFGCIGYLVAVPITVRSFSNVGAISLTVNYDKSILSYSTYNDPNGFIDFAYDDETGEVGVFRFSGISETSFNLDDNDVLITLFFNYNGGATTLTWDDSEDTWCEFATGAPYYNTYCDSPTGLYYFSGTVTNHDLTVNFSADDTTPPLNTDVTFTSSSTGGATSWSWFFDRPSVAFVNGTGANDPNPVVQFTDGGLYTVTLTVYNADCEKTVVKTGYIHAGTPGLWDGPLSTNWYTANNWDDHVIPTTAVNVVIPTRPALHFYPVVPGSLTIGTNCNSITLTGDAMLTVGGLLTVNPGKLLDIKGNATVHATGF